ncbi:protein of unknown function [uncultured Sphingopyxis sp.]|uniref:Uncharacterized protein n=1 Tax=uncultured Sphingopyxis sp. TaxID=310581 RepID=A0A1Y5PVR8_9SPHN|nr:protein of unknown function [uncultured Sphingopyxis sp.]
MQHPRIEIGFAQQLLGHILVKVENNAFAASFQRQAEGHQFRIVQMIEIGVQFARPSTHPSGRFDHSAKPASRTPGIDDPNAIAAAFIAFPVGNHERYRITGIGETIAEFSENARIVPGVDRGQMRDMLRYVVTHRMGHISL